MLHREPVMTTNEPPQWDKWRKEGVWGKPMKEKGTSSGGKGRPKPKGVYPLPHPGPNATPLQIKRHTFAVNLHSLMEERFLIQADLSRLTGINPDTISSYLQEIRTPGKERLFAIAEGLEVSPKRLYKPLKEDRADQTIRMPSAGEGPNKVQMELKVSPETAEAIMKLLKKDADK